MKSFLCQIYTAAVSRDRFREIVRFMRFDNMNIRKEKKVTDKLAPLRAITDIFVASCRDLCDATNVGTIDKQLVNFYERCPFKVYMPSWIMEIV